MAKEHPYRVTVTKTGEKRNTYLLDGMLIIGTRVQEQENALVYAGKNWPLLTVQKAVETVCLGNDERFILKVRNHLDLVLKGLLKEAKGVVEETYASLEKERWDK